MGCCFMHPSCASRLGRLASARMSTGVEIPLMPRVSFQIASRVYVTILCVTTSVAREGPVFMNTVGGQARMSFQQLVNRLVG